MNLKEFTENASHEMQTPIAIAQGKLEILQDSDNLGASEVSLISVTQHALDKMSRLGHALTLLTKIENKEYISIDKIDFSKSVKESLNTFGEIAEMKGLQIESAIEDNVKVKLEDSLADILINNLLKNAIQHNNDQGWIKVSLSHTEFIVANSGLPLDVPSDELFSRFKKGNQSGGSLGLGLSIVSKICELNDLDLKYDYDKSVHSIRVSFK